MGLGLGSKWKEIFIILGERFAISIFDADSLVTVIDGVLFRNLLPYDHFVSPRKFHGSYQ